LQALNEILKVIKFMIFYFFCEIKKAFTARNPVINLLFTFMPISEFPRSGRQGLAWIELKSCRKINIIFSVFFTFPANGKK